MGSSVEGLKLRRMRVRKRYWQELWIASAVHEAAAGTAPLRSRDGAPGA